MDVVDIVGVEDGVVVGDESFLYDVAEDDCEDDDSGLIPASKGLPDIFVKCGGGVVFDVRLPLPNNPDEPKGLSFDTKCVFDDAEKEFEEDEKDEEGPVVMYRLSISRRNLLG